MSVERNENIVTHLQDCVRQFKLRLKRFPSSSPPPSSMNSRSRFASNFIELISIDIRFACLAAWDGES